MIRRQVLDQADRDRISGHRSRIRQTGTELGETRIRSEETGIR